MASSGSTSSRIRRSPDLKCQLNNQLFTHKKNNNHDQY